MSKNRKRPPKSSGRVYRPSSNMDKFWDEQGATECAEGEREGKLLTEGWVTFDGSYEKHFYDILLKDGSTLLKCWPNAGTFHEVKTGKVIKVEEVTHVRPLKEIE